MLVVKNMKASELKPGQGAIALDSILIIRTEQEYVCISKDTKKKCVELPFDVTVENPVNTYGKTYIIFMDDKPFPMDIDEFRNFINIAVIQNKDINSFSVMYIG